MCGYIRDAFDFDGDGKLDCFETAVAYNMLFKEENEPAWSGFDPDPDDDPNDFDFRFARKDKAYYDPDDDSDDFDADDTWY